MKPIYDYTTQPGLQFVVLREDATCLFGWYDYDAPKQARNTQAPVFKTWATFLDYLSHTALKHEKSTNCTDFALLNGDLIIDDSRDPYKWPAARSQYSPETQEFLLEALHRGIVTGTTDVFLGNWANQDGVLIGKVQDLVGADHADVITVYHGTSTLRGSAIKRFGLLPTKPTKRVWSKNKVADTVYFSATPERAMYFARETAKHDAKKLKESKIKRTCEPLILETQVKRGDLHLVADDDWLALDKANQLSDWESSLNLFGQVGFKGGFAANQVRPAQLTLRTGNVNFCCHTQFFNQKILYPEAAKA